MPIPADVSRDIEALKRAVDQYRVVATPVGVFALRVYRAYTGRNPRTGEDVPVPSKTSVYVRIDEQFAIAVLGQPSTPRRADPDELDEELEGPIVDEVPAATVACAALHAHVLATLASKRVAKYSGFGNFVRTPRPARLEFTPSIVWKVELNAAH